MRNIWGQPIAIILFLSMLSLLPACASTTNSESTGQYIDSSAITTKVKATLADKIGVSTLTSINVTTYKGVVQLSGFVDSADEINQAVQLTRSIPGVKAVENSLLVRSNLPK